MTVSIAAHFLSFRHWGSHFFGTHNVCDVTPEGKYQEQLNWDLWEAKV
jgi:hypothetical protein